MTTPPPPPSTTARRPEPSGPICAFGNRLAYTYFAHPAPLPEQLNNTSNTPGGEGGGGGGDHWFTIDDQLVYLSFFQDYGPLNIGCLYRFCLHLHNLLEDQAHKHQRIFLYSSDEPDKKVNAALLLSLYAMVVMRWSVADVLHPISCLELQPYRDAGYSRSDYHLHPQPILYGLSRALSHHLLDLSTFDLAAYEKAEKVEEGDWNWITPGFIAFASPVEAGYTTSTGTTGGGGGRLTRSFRNVLEEFETKNVKVVVRLNKKLYDRQHFLERGIEHVEMYFDDGTNPTMEMCREFIDLSDRVISSGGAVAVHCKAGLGRTGTLIGAYLIYKHGFTADEAIGFMRLMRPGSCVGPQQHFLYENQLEWVRWSAQDELRTELATTIAASASSSSSTALNPQASTSAGGGGGGGGGATGPSTTTNPTTRVELTRPITPPNESELELRAARNRSATPHHHHPHAPPPSNITTAPVTPRRQTSNVPGQPRKTPGRSRHGVSAPEEKDKDSPAPVVVVGGVGDEDGDEDEEMRAAVREEEEMEGITLVSSSSPNKKNRTSSGGGGGGRRTSTRKSLQLVPDDDNDDDDDDQLVEEEEEGEGDLVPTSPKKLLGEPLGSTRPKSSSTTTTTTTTRPTRIAARSNNTTTTTSSSAAASIARSKGAKNLNTVFEAVEGSKPSSSSASTRSRYPLRNVSGRTTPTLASVVGSTTTTTGGVGAAVPNSPSKLPTRIPAKRGVAPSSPVVPSTTATTTRSHGGFDPAQAGREGTTTRGGGGLQQSFANGLAKLGGGNKGRNVRRRRSSMGSQDFVQAG